MAEHHCHVPNCGTPCKPEYLMCPHHWRMVPRNLQLAVYRAYRKGQCDDKNPSREWLQAANDAISAVSPEYRAFREKLTALRAKGQTNTDSETSEIPSKEERVCVDGAGMAATPGPASQTSPAQPSKEK